MTRLLPLLLLLLAVPAFADDPAFQREDKACIYAPGGAPQLRFTLPALMGQAPDTVTADPADDGFTHVTLMWNLKYTVLQDDLTIPFDIAFTPTFWWAPHLAPEAGDCIAQHVFRSPALIAADASHAVALIPDLAAVGTLPDAPWYLDVDAPAKKWSLGISKSEVTDHVHFKKANGARFEKGTFTLAFYLASYPLTGEAKDPFEKIAKFHWRTYAEPLLAQAPAPAVPLDRYVEHTYNWAFVTWRDAVWQEFDINGKPAGAPAFIVNYTQSPNYPGPQDLREFLSIWNQAWFSSLRSASGLYRYATRTNNADLLNRARLTKELALAAPMKDGIFPSVYRTEMETVPVGGKPCNRSKGWQTGYWTNSNRTPSLFGVSDQWYHVLDASWTALQMLHWYQELEQDPRLLDYVKTYADKLLALQYDSGFFPAWLNPDTLEPSEILRRSPETSMSAWLLFELADVTKQRKYRKAAVNAIDAVLKENVPIGRWEDFETYWSCNGYGQETLVGKQDPRSGMYKQCNFGMYWTAEALLAAWHTTKKDHYLAWGRCVLNEMSMTQQVWQPPYVHVPALGGFGVMNFDGEWNDARESLFAETYLKYAQATGEPAYFERGVAALKSAFVMMYCPENPEAKQEWEKQWPFFGKADYGFTMENYGHIGSTRPEDNPMGEFTIYDWGNGAAAEARNRIRDHFGDVYVDLARGSAFGIDGITAQVSGAAVKLSDRTNAERDVCVVFSDGRRQTLHFNKEAELPL